MPKRRSANEGTIYQPPRHGHPLMLGHNIPKLWYA